MDFWTLADQLEELGFQGMADSVREYMRTEGEGWESEAYFLAALRKDVWYHFGHVGEDHERGIYQRAADLISQAV